MQTKITLLKKFKAKNKENLKLEKKIAKNVELNRYFLIYSFKMHDMDVSVNDVGIMSPP